MSLVVVHGGDIMRSPASTLVCPVNAMGVMGAGLASEMSLRVPGLRAAYRDACRRRQIHLGGIWLFEGRSLSQQRVLCAATKHHWEDASQLSAIDSILREFLRVEERLGLHSVAWPLLGAGLFPAVVVAPRMRRALLLAKGAHYLYLPFNFPHTEAWQERRPKPKPSTSGAHAAVQEDLF